MGRRDGRRVDAAKIMPPGRGEMKVRVWECGVRGWVKGGQHQDYASRGDEGESVERRMGKSGKHQDSRLFL